MNKLRHPVTGMVIFALLITLCINIYDGMIVGYNIRPGDNQTVEISGESETTNIAEQFKRLNIIEGVGAISGGVSSLTPGSVRFIDILGALGTIGIGAINVVLGLFSLPGEILNITIGIFYAGEIPAVLTYSIVVFSVYAVFILLSAYLNKDV